MSAPAITAPYFAAVLVLGAAGVAKVLRPDDTARALVAAGTHTGRRSVRAMSAAEVAICLAAFAIPGAVTASLVALSYAAFAVFIILALRRDWPIASCGCFGQPDTPPTVSHAVLNCAATATAVWWAAVGRGSIGSLFVHEPRQGIPLAFMTLLVAGLAYAVWTNPVPRVSR